ncbi:hypothetical protein [Duganella violaceipulchra]|uniref:Uncharacterized protein n=1 Tax=Duganella violaceipulchra TaxID=2849652 RepID=A0AA41HFA1_9BURK|nr:hypothetical protein [Duganella violaceicalia]MBV6323464.1 hypothetical protein [Duganella violaceicalia]MCP2007581.1 hypothetical protein [Duganella violaceicalia]
MFFPTITPTAKDVLKDCINENTAQGLAPGDKLLLCQLIDALPAYQDSTFMNNHRAAIVTLIQTSLPDHQIAPQPLDSEDQGNVTSSYIYTGTARGYLDAFYPNVFPNAPSTALAAALTSPPGLHGVSQQWWSNFSVTALTDAIRIAGVAQVDLAKLSADMQVANATLIALLAPSCLSVLQNGYSPTSITINDIQYTQRSPAIAATLAAAIVDQAFIANANAALQDPGSTQSVVWLLFILWLTLDALQEPFVDSCITAAINAGLEVPNQVGLPTGGNIGWWYGGYVDWFQPITGADIAPAATGITANMQQTETIHATAGGYSGGGTYPAVTANGYSLSFCNWGDLNWYNPQSAE